MSWKSEEATALICPDPPSSLALSFRSWRRQIPTANNGNCAAAQGTPTATGTSVSFAVAGDATARGSGTLSDLTATAADGTGAVAVVQYGASPVSAPAPDGAGSFFDAGVRGRRGYLWLLPCPPGRRASPRRAGAP